MIDLWIITYVRFLSKEVATNQFDLSVTSHNWARVLTVIKVPHSWRVTEWIISVRYFYAAETIIRDKCDSLLPELKLQSKMQCYLWLRCFEVQCHHNLVKVWRIVSKRPSICRVQNPEVVVWCSAIVTIASIKFVTIVY